MAVAIALLGMAWEWRFGSRKHEVFGMQAKESSRIDVSLLRAPNAFLGLESLVTGANGPLEPEGRKQARLAEEARLRTRRLVNASRSNVDCAVMNCIALTFDDGPEPHLTQHLARELKKRQATATFFVLGSRVADQMAVLKQLAKDGHEIGNHTWSHPNLKTLPDPAIIEELHYASNAIEKATGKRPLLMRPPMGEYDARVSAAVHMPLVLWTVDTRDWRDRDPELVYQRSIEGAGRGRVILLHDTYNTTVQASGRIVDELQRQGYVLVTVSELFGIHDQNVQEFSGRILRYR